MKPGTSGGRPGGRAEAALESTGNPGGDIQEGTQKSGDQGGGTWTDGQSAVNQGGSVGQGLSKTPQADGLGADQKDGAVLGDQEAGPRGGAAGMTAQMLVSSHSGGCGHTYGHTDIRSRLGGTTWRQVTWVRQFQRLA